MSWLNRSKVEPYYLGIIPHYIVMQDWSNLSQLTFLTQPTIWQLISHHTDIACTSMDAWCHGNLTWHPRLLIPQWKPNIWQQMKLWRRWYILPCSSRTWDSLWPNHVAFGATMLEWSHLGWTPSWCRGQNTLTCITTMSETWWLRIEWSCKRWMDKKMLWTYSQSLLE